jgi:hypothetical protein
MLSLQPFSSLYMWICKTEGSCIRVVDCEWVYYYYYYYQV